MIAAVWWELTRASGIVAWLFLVAALVWGVLLVSRLLGPSPRPAWMLDLHRWLGGLALAFTGIHLATLIADSYVQFDLVDVLVPFAASWRRGAVAWGVVALWLLVAVEVTSLMMRRLPRRAWRWVHLSSYAALWMATMHGVTAGTDARNPVLQAVLVVLVTLVIVVLGHRVVRGSARGRRTAGAASGRASDVAARGPAPVDPAAPRPVAAGPSHGAGRPRIPAEARERAAS